jgi:hypothetical protein
MNATSVQVCLYPLEVHDRHVGPVLPVRLHSLAAGRSFGNHHHVYLRMDCGGDTGPHQRMIIGAENADTT